MSETTNETPTTDATPREKFAAALDEARAELPRCHGSHRDTEALKDVVTKLLNALDQLR